VKDGSTSSTAGPAAGTVVTDTATCTGGKVAVGGGGSISVTGGVGGLTSVSITDDEQTSPTVWSYSITVNTTLGATVTITVEAQAICANP
jgi:hypothetical protein